MTKKHFYHHSSFAFLQFFRACLQQNFQMYTKYTESFGKFQELSLNWEIINENQSSLILTCILWNISLDQISDILILAP